VNLKKDIERQLPRKEPGQTSEAAPSTLGRLFCSPALRVPMLVGVGLVAAQQLTGQPALLFYVVDIFREVADRSVSAGAEVRGVEVGEATSRV